MFFMLFAGAASDIGLAILVKLTYKSEHKDRLKPTFSMVLDGVVSWILYQCNF